MLYSERLDEVYRRSELALSALYLFADSLLNKEEQVEYNQIRHIEDLITEIKQLTDCSMEERGANQHD